MNKIRINWLNRLEEFLSSSIGQYGYTDKYLVETKDMEEYTEAEVEINLFGLNKKIYLYFEITDEELRIRTNEDNTEEVLYGNFRELIWRQMFFEK